jgi:hypothetical protein
MIPHVRELLCFGQILLFFTQVVVKSGPRGSIDCSGAMLQAGRSRVRVPMRSLTFYNLSNPSSRTMALGFTQPLTEMTIRKCFW